MIGWNSRKETTWRTLARPPIPRNRVGGRRINHVVKNQESTGVVQVSGAVPREALAYGNARLGREGYSGHHLPRRFYLVLGCSGVAVLGCSNVCLSLDGLHQTSRFHS